MFTHHCSACDKTQLIFFSQIRSLTNTDHGIEVAYTCGCGAEQLMITGNKARRGRHSLVA